MQANDRSNSNYYMELHVNDLEQWIKFYTVNMGFSLIKVKKSLALLSDGRTLLKLQEAGASLSGEDGSPMCRCIN